MFLDANAISCYICSWSPEDKELEADRCTNENFDEHRVRSLDCKIGCEKVKILDINGKWGMKLISARFFNEANRVCYGHPNIDKKIKMYKLL